MFYSLYELLNNYDIPGARLMSYISFRSGVALVLSLFIAIVFGRRIINRLQLMQVGEIVRDLGLEGQMSKKGTPTMGGIIIIISIVIPCLLVGNLTNVYMLLMIFSTIWLGCLGFADDYLKLARHNKDGLKGKFKIVGQVGLGLVVGITMYLSPGIVMRENVEVVNRESKEVVISHKTTNEKATQTTIPFVKNNNFDYASCTKWMGKHAQTGGWILFILVTIFVITAVSNGANLTDGLDGLCTGTSAVIGVALAIMCYLGGNVIYSSYLNIMYIPNSAELVVFAAAFIGATIGFLWYNSFPAQVFMGDTGSLTVGGIIGVCAMVMHKELMVPVLCGIFLMESVSVILQTQVYKFYKKRGQHVRIWKRTPFHDHFRTSVEQVLKNDPTCSIVFKGSKNLHHETKIVLRFCIVTLILAAITILTLKIR